MNIVFKILRLWCRQINREINFQFGIAFALYMNKIDWNQNERRWRKWRIHIVEKKVMMPGTSARIAQSGHRVIMKSRVQSLQQANFATSAKRNRLIRTASKTDSLAGTERIWDGQTSHILFLLRQQFIAYNGSENSDCPSECLSCSNISITVRTSQM